MKINYQKIGLSCYLTTKNQKYLKIGHAKGIEKLFISLHIVEEFNNDYQNKVQNFLQQLKQLKFKEVICDISPIGIKQLGNNWLEFLKQNGINVLRLDYGFTIKQIVEIAHHIPVALNASQITEELLIALKKAQLLQKIIGFHNYYPLPGTGLSYQQMFTQDLLLRSYGIKKIYSFMPGKNKMRNNTPQLGLPTLEKHRLLNHFLIYYELIIRFNHQSVFIGDPDFFEFQKPPEIPVLSIIKNDFLKPQIYELRISDNFIRFKKTRMMSFSESGVSNVSYKQIKFTKNQEINKGDLVICNENSRRYMGEIMLCIKNLNPQYNYLFNKITNTKLKEAEITLIKNQQFLEIKNS